MLGTATELPSISASSRSLRSLSELRVLHLTSGAQHCDVNRRGEKRADLAPWNAAQPQVKVERWLSRSLRHRPTSRRCGPGTFGAAGLPLATDAEVGSDDGDLAAAVDTGRRADVNRADTDLAPARHQHDLAVLRAVQPQLEHSGCV
jgi:hypothetical protein